jgi:iron complex outermembrane receptor protein
MNIQVRENLVKLHNSGVGFAEESAIDEKAQKEKIKLKEMVVTATRDIKVLDTPASISVITAKDLEEQGITNIGDAIARIPGVYDDGASKYYFSMRGTRSSSAGGPLVLIDGVPQNVGMYGYNYFETIPVSDIERIEILRSPGSTVFGSDSARGVISIVTKKGKKDQPLGFKVKASGGSWKTFNEYVTLSGGVDKWDYFLTGSRTDTDGYVHDIQRRSATRLKAGYIFSDRARLGINLRYKDNYWETVRGKNKYALDNDRRADEFKENPTAEKTLDNETDQNVSTCALDFSYRSTGLFLNSLAAVTVVDEDYKRLDKTYTSPNSLYNDDRDQDRYKFDLSGGYNLGKGFFQYTPILGFNTVKTSLEQRRDYYNDPDGNATSKKKADIDYDQDKYGVVFQNQFIFGDYWELNAGIRQDYVEYDVKNKNDNSADTDHTEYSWSVAPAYRWNDRSTTYVSAGKSYWYPAPYYYQAAMEKMNPENLPQNLRPESCLVYELGHKHSLEGWTNVSLTFFWMEYKDKFAVFYDDTQTYAGYKNIGDSEHKGIELEMDERICQWFGYRLSGTYMEAEWTSGRERVYTWETTTSRDFRNLDGYDLNRLPKYKYMVGFNFYPIQNLNFNIDVNGTGKYYVDYLNRIEYSGRTTIDTGLRYELTNWSSWILGKNIFDEEIESIYNSSGKLNSSPAEIERNGKYANSYYPKNGQYFEIGLTYHF